VSDEGLAYEEPPAPLRRKASIRAIVLIVVIVVVVGVGAAVGVRDLASPTVGGVRASSEVESTAIGGTVFQEIIARKQTLFAVVITHTTPALQKIFNSTFTLTK